MIKKMFKLKTIIKYMESKKITVKMMAHQVFRMDGIEKNVLSGICDHCSERQIRNHLTGVRPSVIVSEALTLWYYKERHGLPHVPTVINELIKKNPAGYVKKGRNTKKLAKAKNGGMETSVSIEKESPREESGERNTVATEEASELMSEPVYGELSGKEVLMDVVSELAVEGPVRDHSLVEKPEKDVPLPMTSPKGIGREQILLTEEMRIFFRERMEKAHMSSSPIQYQLYKDLLSGNTMGLIPSSQRSEIDEPLKIVARRKK